MRLSYDRYLDSVLGGWIGKSIGGAVGARFEGSKEWIEIERADMIPRELPPNDDLDLQVLWLKVLEEKGAALTSDDLAAAWLEGCWYPFNEYGSFRRNWQLGIHPPYSGQFNNEFWETGEGCPIRSEVWGYVFPGAPDLAAAYARKDGVLDHTEQSVAAEQMLAAMASMAFFIPDVRRLVELFRHYLPVGSPIERMTTAAFAAHDEGLSPREAWQRVMALAGHPEACDAQTNIPFTFLGLLYGQDSSSSQQPASGQRASSQTASQGGVVLPDLVETLLAALRCGYDTDCTLATAGAFVGQILGARRIAASLRDQIGDQLVMGIQYRRPEMTLTALARDTARMGVLLARECRTGIEIVDAPALAPLPPTAVAPATSLRVDYLGEPAAAPGETVTVTVTVEGELAATGAEISLTLPEGWSALPMTAPVSPTARSVQFSLRASERAPVWAWRHLFTATLSSDGRPVTSTEFGVAGSALWRFLGVYFDPHADEALDAAKGQPSLPRFQHHFVYLEHEYLPEPGGAGSLDVAAEYRRWARLLGRPAVVSAPTYRVDLGQVIGLRGQYCAYLERTVICPDEREANLVVGNNDAYRLWLNDELVGESTLTTWWSPFNGAYRVRLRAGENRLLIKLMKNGERLDFTLGIRQASAGHFNQVDWIVDLADANPLAN